MTDGRTPAESWLDAAADKLEEARVHRDRAETLERQAKRYVLLAEQWEREHKEKSGV